MVKAPYLDSNGLKKGAWDEEEDFKLKTFVHLHGHKNWRHVPIYAGINRCGKSCRLRWVNYLNPGLKRGYFTGHEHDLIIELHKKLGSRWSTIASYFPGRTDNDIKNYWHGHIKRSSSKRSKKSIENDKQIKLPPNHKKPSSSSTKDRSNIIIESSASENSSCYHSSRSDISFQENPLTEFISPEACHNNWDDPFGDLAEAFDFELMCQEFAETKKPNSCFDSSSSNASISSLLNDEFDADGNLWSTSSGLFWDGTGKIESEGDDLSTFYELWDSI